MLVVGKKRKKKKRRKRIRDHLRLILPQDSPYQNQRRKRREARENSGANCPTNHKISRYIVVA